MDPRLALRLIDSLPKVDKFTPRFIDWLKTPKNALRVSHPIEYMGSIKAKNRIPDNQTVLMLSTEKTFTNMEIVGCSV